MAFRLEINTENAAFEGDNLRIELVRILRAVARRIETDGDDRGNISDSNGNHVGSFLRGFTTQDGAPRIYR